MANDEIAKRYAAAIYNIAKSSNSINEVREVLNILMENYEEEEEFRKILEDPLKKFPEKEKFLEKSFDHTTKESLGVVKYIVKKQRLSLISDIKEYFLEFTNEVNHSLMGDFISMSNDEIRRYLKLENLLYSKISKRFKVRRLNKNDFGYLIEHIHSGEKKALKEYFLALPVIRLKTASIIKKYDFISPTACLIEEKQRYLKITKDCLV